MSIIEPKTLPGTMELLPKEQILFNEIKSKIQNVYESFGFLPLDTPIIEKSDVLLAKAGGETEKQIYRFTKGDNDICLRFDLTVPLAKYVAANINELEFPFKRYQIGKVYRGEKPQKGRYREFYQCDIDTIGKDTLSIKNDAEYPAVIYSIFKSLDFGDFTIMLNNRKIINGLFEELNLSSQKEDIMRLIDKFDKMGKDYVVACLLDDYQLDQNTCDRLINFLTFEGTTDEKLDMLKNASFSSEIYNTGVSELEEVVKCVRLQGVPDKYFKIKLTIVRGLDYYTGTVYETILNDYPNLGSVCGGGRYDNLAGFYTEQKLPGVGIAIGITRLFYQLCENNLIKASKSSIAEVLVLPMDDNAIEKGYAVASKLRLSGIPCQLYLEDKKFKNKINYADKLKIPYVVIIGEDEVNNNYVTLKDMFNFSQEKVEDLKLVDTVKEKINNAK